MTDWSEVGGDPCPGNLDQIRKSVHDLKSVDDHCRELTSRLAAISNGVDAGTWTGAGATHINTQIDSQLPDIKKFAEAHATASAALSAYLSELEDQRRAATGHLNEYNDAKAALASAQSRASSAQQRYNSANSQVGQLDSQIRQKQTERLLLLGTAQPTTALDAEINRLNQAKSGQISARSQASDDLSAAHRASDDAQHRRNSAKSKIEGCRDLLSDEGRRAADKILAAVGIVESHNPFVRMLADGVDAGAVWLGDAAEVLDLVATGLAVAAVALAFIPGVGWIAAGVAVGLSMVLSGLAMLGHALKAMNTDDPEERKKEWENVGWSALGLIPFGKALSVVGKGGRALTAGQKVPGSETLGDIKRFVWTEDARRAKGPFSSHGFNLPGDKTRRIYASPTIPGHPWITRGLIAPKLVDNSHDVYDLGGDVVDAIQSTASPTYEPLAGGMPVTVMQVQGGGVIQGGPSPALQGL